jgi:DNA-binding SARP family transcriptional activator
MATIYGADRQVDRQNDRQGLGGVLRDFRSTRGLTQDELASRAGVSVRTIRDLEHDRILRPHSTSLSALAKVLNLTNAERDGLLGARKPRSGLYLRLLGPLTVERNGLEVCPPTTKQRRLLALLALHCSQPISREEIIDVLWNQDPPRSYRNLIQTYVTDLRRLLEPDRRAGSYRRLVRIRDAYQLNLSSHELDIAEFDLFATRALRAVAEGQNPQSEYLLAQSLACWRGQLLGATDSVIVSHPAAAALNARRLRVALCYGEAALRQGHAQEAVVALQMVLSDHPFHEGLHARLICLLAASGQQILALAHYGRIRSCLADEFGLDPGSELRAAYLEVLRAADTAR